jgi:succinyl-diaminopimelate desuccinylase
MGRQTWLQPSLRPPKWRLAAVLEILSMPLVRRNPKVDDAVAAQLAVWVRSHAGEMASLLAELVAIPSENPPGNHYAACAGLLEARLRNAGLLCERWNSDPSGASGAACLLASHGQGDRALFFHGHYDVVPAQSPQQFQPRRERDFLFGRGSCDMKGGLVAMLYAIRALQECAVPLAGRVALMMVPDEETGGQRGSAWLAEKGSLGRGGIGMLTAEPTSGVVWNANRGAITLRIEIMGKPAHVGLQHLGENAFERMHRVVAKLLELKREVEMRATRHSVERQEEPEELDAERRAKPGPRNSILLIGGESGGGTNFNVLPEKCWFTVDRRINPEEDFETEKQRLIAELQQCQRDGIPLQWRFLQEGRSASSPEDDALGRALAESIRAVSGQPPRFAMCPGLLENRFYAALGMPAYAYGPGLLSVAHGPDEYVDLRRVADCAAIYALAAAQLLED